jgi:hypothetical protein
VEPNRLCSDYPRTAAVVAGDSREVTSPIRRYGNWRQVFAGVRVERISADGPPGCTAADVVERTLALVDAVNSGVPDLVNCFFKGDDDSVFEWYSVTRYGPADSKDHFLAPKYAFDELAAHFAQRYQQHERLKLTGMTFNVWRGGDEANFGPILLTRSADDMQFIPGKNEYRVEGKGAYNCKNRTFVVLSLLLDLR